MTNAKHETLAGAPGFEPGNGGIKIRCLTTWLRPIRRRKRRRARTIAARRVAINGRPIDDTPMASRSTIEGPPPAHVLLSSG